MVIHIQEATGTIIFQVDLFNYLFKHDDGKVLLCNKICQGTSLDICKKLNVAGGLHILKRMSVGEVSKSI